MSQEQVNDIPRDTSKRQGCVVRTFKYLMLVLGIMVAWAIVLSFGDENVITLLVFMLIAAVVLARGFGSRKRLMRAMRENDGDEARNLGVEQENDEMPILLDGLVVYEAKETATRLERAGVRVRVERSSEDREFIYGGHGGLGTRMCIRVHREDMVRAARVLKTNEGMS